MVNFTVQVPYKYRYNFNYSGPHKTMPKTGYHKKYEPKNQQKLRRAVWCSKTSFNQEKI